MFRGARPLKRWRWVGIFCEELMACAAIVQIGPARQSFWALYQRPREPGRTAGTARVRERTRMLPRARKLELGPGVLRISDAGVALEVALREEDGVQVTCPHGAGEVWTRKQAGVDARGTLSLDGSPPLALRARAVIDDTAGHHARSTECRWSAGVGEGTDGRALAWNLVSGVNDPPSGSERAVWVDGVPVEAPAVAFATDLSSLTCVDGSLLSFSAEAERARRDRLLLVSSDYRAPFGSFSGTLPGAVALARGLGVMEHHRARW